LSVTAVTQPASGHGNVTINANGVLTYTQTVFATGTETFTYTISDGHRGTATATVAVTVNLPAKVGFEMLRDQIASSGISGGKQNSLIVKLNAAQQSLAKHHPNTAANQLNAFANEVRALKSDHTLPADVADLWLLEIQNLLATTELSA